MAGQALRVNTSRLGSIALALLLLTEVSACRPQGEAGSSRAAADPNAPRPAAGHPGPDEVPRHPVDDRPRWRRSKLLPRPVANNPVVGLSDGGVYTVLGLGPGKTHADLVTTAFALPSGANEWSEHPSLPDSPGRLAATAQRVGQRVFVFGGYTVAPDGTEVSLARVDVYEPTTRTWSSAAPMPVPVDDAVSGVWRERFIVLVSGWSQTDNVTDVQIYDTVADAWRAGTPIPGPPVFGHAGGLVGDTLLYCDGVTVHPEAPKFRATSECFGGRLKDAGERVEIEWAPLPRHPGNATYRIAAGSVPARDWIVFAGGTARPYNYDGIGYDGVPAQPETTAFAWDVGEERWRELPELPEPRMDHRGLAVIGDEVVLVGGLDSERRVSSTTWRLRLPS